MAAGFPISRVAPAAGVLLALLALIAQPSRASERIVLKNGFTLLCAHHADRANDRVRLYMGPGDENYLDVDAAEIAKLEVVPDPAPARAAPLAQTSKEESLTPEELHEILDRAGARYDLDTDLLASVVQQESGGNPRAVSRTGAQGLMQLMPGTAARRGVADSFVPGENVAGGASYLDALLTRYHGNVALALAAYNAGPAAVEKYRGIPPYRETRVYVARVIREFNRRKRAEMRRPRP